MKIRAQAAVVGMMLVVAGCGGEPASSVIVTPGSAAPSPSATAVVIASPTASAVATPSAAAATATPAASSAPQPSAAVTAKPSAAVATAAPVKEATSAKPSPSLAPAPASAAPTPSAKPQAADDGATTTAAQAQVLYKDNCMACHGAGLAGDFGPNLTKVGSRKTKDEIVTQIIKGKGDMPPFQSALKSEEIEALAAWLAAKK